MKMLSFASLISVLVASPSYAGPARLQRADQSFIQYHVERPDVRRRQPLILLLQGSGCEPVANDSQLASTARVLAPGHATLMIEKYGAESDAPVRDILDGCSAAFWEGNTLQQRVADAVQVIAHLRKERWWNGRIVIFGGSEGGAVAALLAPLIPETRAVVIRSSGIGVPVGELIRRAVPPPVAAELPRIMSEAKANPTGRIRWGGASYRWWADAVDLIPATTLLQTEAPILLIQGASDQYAPVATARATRDLFAAANKPNLTYREYPRYDQFMVDEQGVKHGDTVLREAALWLQSH
jgi:pimeloyl-ACP methyl ester carboxylesterase